MRENAIELRHLKYFVALAEELSFSRAAIRCHVTQPPFSIAIQQLESYLGLQLVVRNTRYVELTETGREFYTRALQLTRHASQTFTDIRKFAGGLSRKINVGFHASMIYRGLPQMILRFQEEAREVGVSLSELSSKRQYEGVLAGDLDIGFTHSLTSITRDDVHCVTLFAERFLLCVPDRYRIRDDQVDLADFKDENFILFDRDASPHYFDTILSVCLQAGFSPRIEHRVRQWLTVVAMVSQGMGVSIVPECLAHTGLQGVLFRPIATDITSNLQCIHSSAANPRYVEIMMRIARETLRPDWGGQLGPWSTSGVSSAQPRLGERDG